jgi:hypothetical protein
MLKSVKEFIKNVLKINREFYYNFLSKKTKDIINKAFENYQNNVTFDDCDEEKIKKIISAFNKYKPLNLLEILCKYISKEDLKEVQIIDFSDCYLDLDEVKRLRRKIKWNRRYYLRKGIDDFKILEIIIEIVYQKFKKQENILTDNEITLDKLKLFSEREINYIVKEKNVLFLIKKLPMSILENIRKDF